MSDQKTREIPFDLNKFKAGMKARHKVMSNSDVVYRFTTANGKTIVSENINGCTITEEYVNVMHRDYVMVSRHHALIDSYDPADTYMYTYRGGASWSTVIAKPLWDEETDYRIHPHNDLIKAWKRGAKIIQVIDKKVPVNGLSDNFFTFETEVIDDPNPTWDTDKVYRIKLAPTITVPFPIQPFSLDCGDKPEVRQWLKDNECKWKSGDDLTEYRLDITRLNVCPNKRTVAIGYIDDNILIFDPFKQPEPEFTYPIVKINLKERFIVKFTSLNSAEIIMGYGQYVTGEVLNDLYPHTDDSVWHDIATPRTKTVYEWMVKNPEGNHWHIKNMLMTEEEVVLHYNGFACMKTGRSWEVEV